MHIVDLSHVLRTSMPVFPGDEPVNLRRTRHVKRDGYAMTTISTNSHAGTHVDVAAHLFADAPGLDWLGPDNFIGWGAVIDLTNLTTPAIDQQHLAALADIDNLDFALLYTGWEQHWKTDRYFISHPHLTHLAARYLAGLSLKGVGLDTPSPDPADSPELHAHQTLLNHGLAIIENLRNLGGLPAQDFLFSCLPLRLADAEASPVRAVGITF
jgi:kynurenine formamidase